MNRTTILRRAIIAGMGLLALPAYAELPFDQLIVFGASYEDVGQFPDYDFVAEAFPSLVAAPGAGLDGSTGLRVTNIDPATGRRGQVWVEMLADDIGTGPLVPSTPLLYPGARSDIPDTDNIDFAFVDTGDQRVADSRSRGRRDCRQGLRRWWRRISPPAARDSWSGCRRVR